MIKNLFNLDSKIIVITGGSGYLGKEISSGLTKFGAIVTNFDNQAPEENQEKSHFKKCDLNSIDEISRCYAEVIKEFGKIDVLICAAAYSGYAGSGKLHEMSIETWNKGIDGTLNITFKSIKAIIPIFKEIGSGNIITFGSLYSWIAPDFSIYNNENISPPNYGAGKAAIIQLTRHVASQYAEFNIRANSVTPGAFPHLNKVNDEIFLNKLSSRNMMSRVGKPQDLVGPIAFLASDASEFITATNINVDGGQLNW